MDFPLAHDETGTPISVPGNASGWLVRKHSGGRGRPAAVYDDDGRPLVVPLESTAADLRSIGCRPGMYRLDAVDDGRAQLGATAYTEVRRDGISLDDREAGETPAGYGDAAVAALARAVEAMQRVQAEREKAQAERERAQTELIERLVERLSPPAPVPAPRNLREVIEEHLDVTKRIKKLAPREEKDGEDDGEDASLLEKLQPTIQKVVGLVEMALYRKLAPSLGVEPPAAPKTAEVEDAEPESGAESKGPKESEQSKAEETDKEWTDAEIALRLNQVEARLSEAERHAVKLAIGSMTQETLAMVTQQVMTLSVDEAVAEIRRLLGGGAPPNGKTKPSDAGSSPVEGVRDAVA